MRKFFSFLLIFLLFILPSYTSAFHTRSITAPSEPKPMTIQEMFNFDVYWQLQWEADEFYQPEFVNMSIYNDNNPHAIYYRDGKYYNYKWERIDKKTHTIKTTEDIFIFLIDYPKTLPAGKMQSDIKLLVNGEERIFNGSIAVKEKIVKLEVFYQERWEKRYLLNGTYDATNIPNSEWLYNGITMSLEAQAQEGQNKKSGINETPIQWEEVKNTKSQFAIWALVSFILIFIAFIFLRNINKNKPTEK